MMLSTQLGPGTACAELASGEANTVLDRELRYLVQVLGESSPGRRLLDLGCGTGNRARALAAAGYEVTACDPSEHALAEARHSAEVAGIDVRWRHIDPLRDHDWPLETVDAAVCLCWPATAPEVDQRRLLRRIRHQLTDGGVLVIGHQPASVIEPLPPPAEDATSATIRRRRLQELEVSARSTAALVALVRLSGFGVERTDANFVVNLPANPATETLQIVARTLPGPPEALAVSSWTTPSGIRLDLRYASDEAELLDPDPSAVWEELVRSAGRGGAEVVAGYPVDDPYGGVRGAPEVARFFGIPLAPCQLTFAAGVTSLLHDLAGMADGGRVSAPELVHPDLEAWATTGGSEIHLLAGDSTRERLLRQLEAVRPALLHLDRPDFIGRLLPLDELAAVAQAAARYGTTVVIDESPAPYLGPAASAATLLDRVDNLVVLRGFTKAYSLGGMRAAFAVASRGVARRVRELVAPMQVGELALRAAVRLLAAGDMFGRLRARVREVKPLAVGLLRDAGLEVLPNHELLPWVGLTDLGGATSAALQTRGIRALRPAPAPVLPEPRLEVLRLTIPLSDERMALFRTLLTGREQEG